jgi:hydroxylamine reductase
LEYFPGKGNAMFCYQCQEAVGNTGCVKSGACGKKDSTSNLQDLLIYTVKGVAVYAEQALKEGTFTDDIGKFMSEVLFVTITNANFDDDNITTYIKQTIEVRNKIKAGLKEKPSHLPLCATWNYETDGDITIKAATVGILTQKNEDVRSLRELAIYGLKGMSAYAHHAAVLGFESREIYAFIAKALVSTTKDLSVDEMVAMVMEVGKYSVDTLALLDKANTETYGNPELTEVNIGVSTNPGILISGHDLKDMEQLLKQTEGTGVDVYTHSEMLPANYYPKFKTYKHFVGNYGNAWWKQNKEFESFNGPIVMTTNCITPPSQSYKNRIFTTGVVSYPEVQRLDENEKGEKDFSKVIELAKTCAPPVELETGKIVGGFAHNQIIALADKVVAAVKSGDIKRFVVMAGCDGRQNGRNYFTETAKALPDNTVILTAGCAKYRYNKLDLGDIGGIPRVLDAGQCNDSYSLAVVALKLKEVFGLDDINDLPISYDIAWYEQKAVTVLLALLSLGVKGIRLGPTLPAFLSPNVAKVLVENFDIKGIGTVEDDVKAMMEGK